VSLPNFIIEIPIVLLFTLHITKNIAYDITEVLNSMQINLWWQAIPKICVYLISRFYSNGKNLMLTKYMFYSSSRQYMIYGDIVRDYW